MALTRRSTQRVSGSIWPGFVDAMTALLLVLMFVLTIFMIVQFVLRETIAGQATELDELGAEVDALASALGLEQQRSENLNRTVAERDAALEEARALEIAQSSLISSLREETARQAEELVEQSLRATGFEAQVASLLAERDAARTEGASLAVNLEALRDANDELISQRQALELALARARDEIDAQTEAARLAAARREALETFAAELAGDEATRLAERLDAAELSARLEALEEELDEGESERLSEQAAAERLRERLAEIEGRLGEEEIARLAEAAAAEALRARLADSDAELTAMTLALEEQRKQAEETLTLLAAAKTAEEDLAKRLAAARARLASLPGDADVPETDERLAEALAAQTEAESAAVRAAAEADHRAALLAAANAALQEEEAKSAESLRKVAALNAQIAALRGHLGTLQSLLDDAAEKDAAAQVQIESLGNQLNSALARVASEEKRRADAEEELRLRLEEENRELAQFRSEFFGRIRQVLSGREGIRIEGDRFVFSSEVLFGLGVATLEPEGREQIRRVANILAEVADEIPSDIDWVIRVDGHTDNLPVQPGGRYADNWELSQARALSVVRFLTEQLDFPPQRLAAAGFGEYRPAVEADTPEARTRNRRIELKLTER